MVRSTAAAATGTTAATVRNARLFHKHKSTGARKIFPGPGAFVGYIAKTGRLLLTSGPAKRKEDTMK